MIWDPTSYPQESFDEYWGRTSVPSFLVITRDGRVARERIGAVSLEAKIISELENRVSPNRAD